MNRFYRFDVLFQKIVSRPRVALMGNFLVELGTELKFRQIGNTPQPALNHSPTGDMIKTTVDFDGIAQMRHIRQTIEFTSGSGRNKSHPAIRRSSNRLSLSEFPPFAPLQIKENYFAGSIIVESALRFIGSLFSFLLSRRISFQRALLPS